MNHVHAVMNAIVTFGEKAIAFVQPAIDKVVSVALPWIKSVGETLAPYVAHPAFAVVGLVVLGAVAGYEVTKSGKRIVSQCGKFDVNLIKIATSTVQIVIAVALMILIAQKVAVVVAISAPIVAIACAGGFGLGVLARGIEKKDSL